MNKQYKKELRQFYMAKGGIYKLIIETNPVRALRTINILLRTREFHDMNPLTITESGSKRLRRLKEIGEKTILYIGQALKHGNYIDDLEKWVMPYPKKKRCPYCNHILKEK